MQHRFRGVRGDPSTFHQFYPRMKEGRHEISSEYGGQVVRGSIGSSALNIPTSDPISQLLSYRMNIGCTGDHTPGILNILWLAQESLNRMKYPILQPLEASGANNSTS